MSEQTLTDKQTQDYFNRFTPHFNPKRFNFAVDFLRGRATPEQQLVDIGCGDGATLALVAENTPLKQLTGFDVAQAYLDKAATATGCETICGSILDPDLVRRHRGRFDYAVLGAVLHHLIGPSRTASREAAATCVQHALRLLRPGGHLIIFEPTYGPRVAMWGVFWIKRLVGSVISNRWELGPQWLNIAQPVVSYYNADQVRDMVLSADGEVVEFHVVDRRRLGGLIQRMGVGLVAAPHA